MKRHHDHGNSYKGKHLIGVAYSSEVWSTIIMVGHGGMQADMVLEKELRILYLDPKVTGSELRHWKKLEHRRPQSPLSW